MRNLPGVELCQVSRLNLLQLAPGGHVGRFVIWTESAFKKLDSLYGTYRRGAEEKAGFRLPRAKMANSDLGRIINSDEIQSVLRAAEPKDAFRPRRKNPLTNLGFMVKLNPYALSARRQAIKATEKKNTIDKKAAYNKKKAVKARRKDFYAALTAPSGYQKS
eukprot:TRINITY_DN6615_c0_g1_i2.p2 TRINITY_DN6615_c0_g1~~TRINITY_DN6615_c0_g1_i2.p2  ORF type:complete len:162 (-),score=43.51 TRINITY_DN6615_c0_g1_i2:81-566(-)